MPAIILDVKNSSELMQPQNLTSFDEVVWALSCMLTWHAESVAGKIGAYTKTIKPCLSGLACS